MALAAFAVAQMGVHLVFFLHITTGPDNTNNVLALAFGVLIVFLVMIGTIWIMGHMNTNMTADPALIATGDFTYRSGMEAAEKLLALADRPSAIFASNDDMAAAAVAVAHRHHLDVPTDLSVCGFDDTTMARSTWPELTTIRQPVAAMAGQAIGLLVDHVHDRQRDEAPATREVRMDFELVSRASVAPPPR